MNTRFWIGIVLIIVLGAGCVTYSMAASGIKQKEDTDMSKEISSVVNSKKELAQFHDDIHEHLQHPILKLRQDESHAKPCKLSWTKSDTKNWQIFMIDENKNSFNHQ